MALMIGFSAAARRRGGVAAVLRARTRSARGRVSFCARSFGPRGTESEWVIERPAVAPLR
eukprot:4098529-Prymnesium_polylepis.1